jgi:hypothetical protein
MKRGGRKNDMLKAVDLFPDPSHAGNAPDTKVGELIKGGRGEVKVGELASLTAVSKSNCDTLSLVCGAGELLTRWGLVRQKTHMWRLLFCHTWGCYWGCQPCNH